MDKAESGEKLPVVKRLARDVDPHSNVVYIEYWHRGIRWWGSTFCSVLDSWVRDRGSGGGKLELRGYDQVLDLCPVEAEKLRDGAYRIFSGERSVNL